MNGLRYGEESIRYLPTINSVQLSLALFGYYHSLQIIFFCLGFFIPEEKSKPSVMCVTFTS